MNKKWFAVIPPYFAVWVGIFLFHSAWGALVGFHLTILASLVWLKPKPEIGALFRASKWRYILGNVLLCTLGGFALYILRDWLGSGQVLREQVHQLGLDGAVWFGFIAYFVLINPIVEEYFWRGVLGSETRLPFWGDVIFAGYHIMIVWNKIYPPAILLVVAALIFAGWMWRQIYRKEKSLLAPVLGHAAADFSILMTVYWLTR